jgi:hypothetical protein
MRCIWEKGPRARKGR